MEISFHSALHCCNTKPPLFFNSKSSLLSSHHSVAFPGIKSFSTHIQGCRIKAKQLRNGATIYASEAKTKADSTDDAERWLLEPVGDGDTSHIGFKVPMPSSFEIASSVVTVGRVPEKADLIIPVATVSGRHARIEKKEGNLVVTDLDSTNGTFVDTKRLTPGYGVTVSSGSFITFGDTSLARFRVTKLENTETLSEPPETADETPDVTANISEIAS